MTHRSVVLLIGLVVAIAPARNHRTMGVPSVEMTTIAYVTGPDADPVRQTLDLYRPDGGTDLPILIYAHGGVWQRGGKDQYRNIGEAFARRGVLTGVLNYRLSPAVRHPAHAQDAAAAVAWLARHGTEYGARVDRIFLSGHSAGGHLASLLLFDAQYLRAEGIEPESLAGVIPLSGIFDLTKPVDDTPEGGFAGHIHSSFGDDPAVLQRASPIRHLHPTRVPILVILAGNDYGDMQRQSQIFVEALRQHQIPARLEVVAGRGHFELVNAIGQEGDPTTELIMRFIEEHAP